MRAMQFNQAGMPLEQVERPLPQPSPDQVRLKVSACGVCRTDLHILDGDLTGPKPQLIPGHEIVGYIDAMGAKVQGFRLGQRVGVPWLGQTCGHCHYCQNRRENLCDQARFTGYHLDGGYAEYTVAHQQAVYALPEGYSDVAIAPLLCAGLIGYRAYRMAGDGTHLGLFGFGAAAHILCQIAVHQGQKVYAFTRPGDHAAQQLALQLGAEWAGDSAQTPPQQLDAAIIFAAVGALVPTALQCLAKGGRVVCAGIHMSPIPEFSYDLLWGERSVCSVANLTRADGEEFLQIAAELPIKTTVSCFALEQANEALRQMASGQLTGAAVLKISESILGPSL